MTVDGQRPPKPAPMPPLRLRNLIPQPVVIEISLAEWLEAERWESTTPMDLSELKGSD